LGRAGAIFHFHAKDTYVDAINTAKNGVLDTGHYGNELERSWIFRTVGYGHGADYWKEIISELRLAGYDYAISIEHEDSLMSSNEGLNKAIACLKDVLIPYWKEKAAFARAHNVKIALELHPGFCVYNTKTLLRLRQAVGPEIGANLDPSHLIWQGMDLCTVIRELGKAGAIFHFHAKDTYVDPINTAMNGVLDTEHYGKELNRSWIFRTVGYGHGVDFWKAIISELRLVGYDYAISIEHEDSLMSSNEGLNKAIACLKDVLIFEDKGEMFWA
jgi:sugar phosphate isomerase/epimerase